MPSTIIPVTPAAPATDSKRGVVDVASGDKTGAVVFAEAFASSPSVNCTVLLPDGSAAAVTPTVHTVSATGFTWRLSAPTPAAGYKLHWHAIV